MSMIDSVLGGLAVGLGATAYMTIYDGTLLGNIVATFCFSIIMMAIPFYKLDFFVGRPGILTDKNTDPVESIIVYMGNFIGITWIALLMKVFPEYGERIGSYSHAILEQLHNLTWDTVFVLSMFAGMMFYAGAMAVNRGQTVFYFMLVNIVCVFAQWPTIHLIVWSLWSDTWDKYWYLIFPTTLGNVVGSNLWYLLRRHSPTFKNKDYVIPDSYDIADKFREFVLNNQNYENNKDNFFHMSDGSSQDS